MLEIKSGELIETRHKYDTSLREIICLIVNCDEYVTLFVLKSCENTWKTMTLQKVNAKFFPLKMWWEKI